MNNSIRAPRIAAGVAAALLLVGCGESTPAPTHQVPTAENFKIKGESVIKHVDTHTYTLLDGGWVQLFETVTDEKTGESYYLVAFYANSGENGVRVIFNSKDTDYDIRDDFISRGLINFTPRAVYPVTKDLGDGIGLGSQSRVDLPIDSKITVTEETLVDTITNVGRIMMDVRIQAGD